jgi:hypothetical protein
MNESFNVAPGGAVESYQPRNKINQIYGVWVDNFSGGWLGIFGTGLWIPPYTRGWKASIFPGITAITIRSYDFANGAIIAGATGQAAIVTLWDSPNGDSDGIEFFDAQSVPRVIVGGGQFVGAGFVNVIPAPAVGRIRVYDIRLSYNTCYNIVSSSVAGFLIPTGFPLLNIANLEINPSKSNDSITIVPPGGDLPIGIGMDILLIYIDGAATDNPNITWAVRYAIR